MQPHFLNVLAHAPAAAPVGVSASASIVVTAATIPVLSAFLPTPFIVIIAPPVVIAALKRSGSAGQRLIA